MNLQAERYLVHPTRILTVGRSKSGKSTEIVHVIDQILRHQIDRFVCCCPTWNTQRTFDPIRDMIKNPERDILTTKQGDPFPKLLRQLVKQKELCELKGMKPIRTLLFVDDLAGTKILAAKKESPLGQIAIQAHHLSCSLIVISQQPKSTDPTIRQNMDAYMVFPPSGKSGRDWIHEELNGNGFDKELFTNLILKAWMGGKEDYTQMNQHFLFVLLLNRRPTRYFSDFIFEMTPKKYLDKVE